MSSSDGQAPADEEMSAEEFEELPTSDIEVEIRIGFGMTGSFPLRLADLFFVEDGLYVAEYEYLTPIFGLGSVFESFAVDIAVVGSGAGGYVLWVLALVVQVYTMYRSARAKLDASGTVEGAEDASGLLA